MYDMISRASLDAVLLQQDGIFWVNPAHSLRNLRSAWAQRIPYGLSGLHKSVKRKNFSYKPDKLRF